jgi:hypothetical protein
MYERLQGIDYGEIVAYCSRPDNAKPSAVVRSIVRIPFEPIPAVYPARATISAELCFLKTSLTFLKINAQLSP